jgi:hypothetical protein
LIGYTLKHYGKADIMSIFGKPELELYSMLINDSRTRCLVSNSPVFYVDGSFNVYPNCSEPSPHWCLGNLYTDGSDKIVDNYLNSRSAAQRATMAVPIGEMVRICGNAGSLRLFGMSDYKACILSKYLENCSKYNA